ncbi:MAG TPA: NAD(+) synthase [Syntrophomonadaceae bacterium]|nr:NAD(+) synthase [Syntrophomonadaceae bacterium]
MNAEAVVEYLVDWLRQKVAEAGASGVVLGVSGGVDSAVAAIIAKKAFPDDCLALLLPCESHISDLVDSQVLVERFNIPYRIIELDNAFNLLSLQLESYIKLEGIKGKLLRANIKPRLRMLTLYYSAQGRNYLVVGTSNKSEISVGYATKYGDTGVDVQILGDLLKSEVYELARYLGVPSRIMNRPPSGGLWEGQTDEGEMGITYDELEQYINNGSGRPEIVEKIKTMEQKSRHKRELVPIAFVQRLQD